VFIHSTLVRLIAAERFITAIAFNLQHDSAFVLQPKAFVYNEMFVCSGAFYYSDSV
jgi:hypothetical protein